MRALLLVLVACGGTARAPTEPTPLDKPPPGYAAPANETRCSDKVVLRGTKHAGACNTIRAMTPTDEATIDEDIRELYKTALFDDIVAVVEGSTLVYELRDRATIERIDVINAPPGLTLPTHGPNGLADPVLIRRNADAMRAALREAGYRNANVVYAMNRREKILVLTYTITAGARTVLGDVKFKGLDAKREATIRKQLATQLGTPVLDDVTQRDVITVQSALYEEGLLNSRLAHEIVDAGPAKVDLVFTITEGPVFTLGAMKVKGPRAKDTKAYAKALAPLKRGAVARRSILVEAVRAIEDVHAGEQPAVIVIPQSNVQLDKKRVDFDFVVE